MKELSNIEELVAPNEAEPKDEAYEYLKDIIGDTLKNKDNNIIRTSGILIDGRK